MFTRNSGGDTLNLDGMQRSERFKCNFAIGFQGKSLTNKAYRSTKSMEDEVQQFDDYLP